MGGQCLVRPIDNHYHAEEDYYGSMMGPVHSTYCEAPEAKHYLVMCRNSPNSDFYFDKIEGRKMQINFLLTL